MPTTAETINYNSFLTTTIKNYSKIMVGQYLTRRPGVGLFFDEYRHTDSSGGRTWQGMVDYGQSATAQFFAGSDTFSTQPQEVAQPLRYDWKYLGGSIAITKTEQLENSGPVALASLLDTRMKQLNRTFDLVIGNEIYSDGTNFGGKSFVGLAAGISTTPTTGAVGGLDPADVAVVAEQRRHLLRLLRGQRPERHDRRVDHLVEQLHRRRPEAGLHHLRAERVGVLPAHLQRPRPLRPPRRAGRSGRRDVGVAGVHGSPVVLNR